MTDKSKDVIGNPKIKQKLHLNRDDKQMRHSDECQNPA